ncbi:hypothetical protein LOD99_14063 [Oopsacas minuta]|uniref:Uncharacterized protein n=1 Tax=Oopsacas minuta TaxID=111878 RepID=A0AAV7KGQ5_9METZ|nr:hypothetical protein LOD99_14063 [Oopsacas minuta]
MANDDVLPPAYDEVIGDADVITPSAPPIAVQPIGPVSPIIPGAPIGFDVLLEPPSAKQEEAKGSSNPIPAARPGYDPEDDILAPVAAAPRILNIEQLEQGGKREFVIKLTCPSCDCSKLLPHSGNLTCCAPELGCLKRLKYCDCAAESKLFPNYYWSKITDRHFCHFFRKYQSGQEPFAKYFNSFIFTVFTVITTIMFVITPWIAIIPAILLECDQNAAIRPLLGTVGAVLLAESFMRSFCYVLHKIDRPPRAIKELESPNALVFIMLGLFIAIFVNIADLTSCENATIPLTPIPPTVNDTVDRCCDPTLMSVAFGLPISWIVFQFPFQSEYFLLHNGSTHPV